MKALHVYWSRKDFRLDDNLALFSSLKKSREEGSLFLPVFILEDYMVAGDPAFQYSYTSRVLLSKMLPEFASHFSDFFVIQSKVCQVFVKLAGEFNLTVHVNEDVHPDFYKQIQKLKKKNIKIALYNDALTVDRETRTQQGGVYSIFTPFKNAVLPSFLEPKMTKKSDPITGISYADRKALKGLKIIDVSEGKIVKEFADTRLFKIGKKVIDLDTLVARPTFKDIHTTEKEALSDFKKFIKNEGLVTYRDNRDMLKSKNSRMSVALAWGLVSSRMLVREIKASGVPLDQESVASYLSELVWREFYKYILIHNQKLLTEEFQPRYRHKIEWIEGKEAYERFSAWIKGETGFPIVDAAMRELASTGLMHNRSRMIVGSILTKNFGIDWRWGQEYFRAILADLDEASNNGGWQWSASVGADPKPIRIFNAELQAKNYDTDNEYRDRWLDKDYDLTPIVDHKITRNEALARYGLNREKPVFRDY